MKNQCLAGAYLTYERAVRLSLDCHGHESHRDHNHEHNGDAELARTGNVRTAAPRTQSLLLV